MQIKKQKQGQTEIEMNEPREDIMQRALYAGYTINRVLPRLGSEVFIKGTDVDIVSAFNAMVNDLPRQYIRDLHNDGLFMGGLSLLGINYLKSLFHESGNTI